MKKALTIIQLSALVAVLLFFSSCNKISKDTRSNSMLIIQSLTGTDTAGSEANFLQSDVLTVLDPETMISDMVNTTVIADIAKVEFTAELLSPGLVETSQYSDIIVNRYVVSFTRSDGKNVEGVDVPYSFEGALSALVNVGTSTSADFVIVREVAKLEPPLVELHDGRGDGVLQVKARIDFYGHDLANKSVMATGYLSIFFANYTEVKEPDPSGGGNR
jgi:hypothetical protein